MVDSVSVPNFGSEDDFENDLGEGDIGVGGKGKVDMVGRGRGGGITRFFLFLLRNEVLLFDGGREKRRDFISFEPSDETKMMGVVNVGVGNGNGSDNSCSSL